MHFHELKWSIVNAFIFEKSSGEFKYNLSDKYLTSTLGLNPSARHLAIRNYREHLFDRHDSGFV